MIASKNMKYVLHSCAIVLCALMLPFDAAMAQQLAQGTDAADLTLWRFVGAFFFILLLIGGALIVVRSRGGSLPFLQNADSRRVKLLEVQRISPQSQICLIGFEEKEYLLALTSQGATVIEVRSAAATVADE